MKIRNLFLAMSFLSLGTLQAQMEMDAYKFSRNDVTGTARVMGMGGAFGALGDDISAVSINPAGIGAYKRSEVVTTLNFQNTTTETKLVDKFDKSKFNFTFDNLAFVTVYNLDSESVPSINFGFSYNRLKSFNREYFGLGKPTSTEDAMSDYIAHRSNLSKNYLANNRDNWKDSPWLPMLAYNSGLIIPASNYNETTQNYAYVSVKDAGMLTKEQSLWVKERGSVATYDFNMGTTVSNVVSLGMTLSFTDINYRQTSSFYEAYGDNKPDYLGDYYLENELVTDGSGLQVALGMIFKPINELRFGVAYHSPTWYNMTDRYSALLDHKLTDLKGHPNAELPFDYKAGTIYSYDDRYAQGVYDYTYYTPDKWTFSLAGLIGTYAKVTLDYGITNYGKMKLYEHNGNSFKYDDPNMFLKRDFKSASSLNLGVEGSINKQFSIRAGLAWYESPVKATLKNRDNDVLTAGAVTQYIIEGDSKHFTYGMGYRFTRNFYTDIAFVFSTQKDDLYFYDWSPDVYKLKTDKVQGLLTLGYRF